MKSNKMLICLFVFCVSILGASLSGTKGQKSGEIRFLTKQDTIPSVMNQVNDLSDLDSLLVIHFHPEVQCSCCISVGNFAKKGLEKFYAKPYKDSLIIFREYNIDEDSSTAKKYKIFWSALGFKKLLKEKNEFKEIESVWEFCEDEENFLLNFRKELDEFIISSKKTKSKAGDTKQDMAKPNGKPQSDFQEKKLR